MNKICIIGSSGSGKSSLSLRLGEVLNIPVYHLDKLFWKPGWIEMDNREFAEILKPLTHELKWIMDGNFSSTYRIRFEQADTIIFLDFNRYSCIWGIAKRYFKYRGKTREDLPEGCPEKFDYPFLKWVWNFPKRTRPNTLKKLDEIRNVKNVVILKTRKETEKFMRNINAVKI